MRTTEERTSSGDNPRPSRMPWAGRIKVIVLGTIGMLVMAATAYAAVHPIPPDRYPPGCHPNGKALQGDDTNQILSQTLKGTPRRDLLRGGGGTDYIIGRRDPDCLFGERGGDSLSGRDGDDRMSGGPGADQFWGAAGAHWIVGAGGQDQANGGAGRDAIRLGPGYRDFASGGPGNDRLQGGAGRDRLIGGRGNDQILDVAGPNRIGCGPGFDRAVTNEQSEVASSCEMVVRSHGEGASSGTALLGTLLPPVRDLLAALPAVMLIR